MTLSDLKDRAAYLAKQAGYTEAVPAPDFGVLVNKGYVDWGWDTEFQNDSSTFTTVSNQAEYTLPTPYWKNIREVVYGTTIALRPSTEADEYVRDPLWTQRPMGTPDRYILERPNVIRLVDPPSNAGDTVSFRGTRTPAALSADTDLPLFPDTWHEAIALRAAVLCVESFVSADADVARVQDYRAQYVGMVKECKFYLTGQRYRTLRRRMTFGFRGRVFLDGVGRPW